MLPSLTLSARGATMTAVAVDLYSEQRAREREDDIPESWRALTPLRPASGCPAYFSVPDLADGLEPEPPRCPSEYDEWSARSMDWYMDSRDLALAHSAAVDAAVAQALDLDPRATLQLLVIAESRAGQLRRTAPLACDRLAACAARTDAYALAYGLRGVTRRPADPQKGVRHLVRSGLLRFAREVGDRERYYVQSPSPYEPSAWRVVDRDTDRFVYASPRRAAAQSWVRWREEGWC